MPTGGATSTGDCSGGTAAETSVEFVLEASEFAIIQAPSGSEITLPAYGMPCNVTSGR